MDDAWIPRAIEQRDARWSDEYWGEDDDSEEMDPEFNDEQMEEYL